MVWDMCAYGDKLYLGCGEGESYITEIEFEDGV